MNIKQRIHAFVQIGNFLQRYLTEQPLASEVNFKLALDELIHVNHTYNNWFIPAFTKNAISGISKMLTEPELEKLQLIEIKNKKLVAVICAGNIPMVAFHDILCVLLSGHKVLIKLSSDDKVLLPFLLKLLCFYEPSFEENILFAEGKMANFDAVIATGSNNTANYFQHYFGKYPNIIRKNRTSVAVFEGNETKEDFVNLGKDIFLYFGLGCRNVSQLLVPQNYKFDTFFEAIIDYAYVLENNKYCNNYDYHRAIYLLEQMPFLDNNFVMIRESSDLFSPVGTIYYKTYSNTAEIEDYLAQNSEKIQCIVGNNHIPFGNSQFPVITDFADNVNTINFLVNL